MFFERIESPGLAHNSYMVGDQAKAAVIDPRRDVDVYVDTAMARGMQIVHILETHRNEDYVSGSTALAARTGAAVWHADGQWDYAYGRAVEDGQMWEIGSLTLRAMHTPGHTPGHMSYVLYDPDGAAWMVFTGDTLFAGDVGRVDLMGMDRAPEMAGHLYESLTAKILPLGDHVLVCPAHGAGSVCGSSIADRPWTTIGLERRLNPKLQFTERDEFVRQVAAELERPPYFRRMEKWNLEGAPLLCHLPVVAPLEPGEFAQRAKDAQVVDTRTEMAFGAAHVPGAFCILEASIASYAGWYLSYDRPVLLVTEDDDPLPAMRSLVRTGYDDVAGHLSGGMLSWHTAGRPSESIDTVTVQELCHRLDAQEDAWILDVRAEEELEQVGRIEGATQIHLTQLPWRLDEVPRDRPVYVFCGSGRRSIIAASLLRREGWDNLAVVLGGIAGWNSITCAIVKGRP